jgi:hypothetical protein
MRCASGRIAVELGETDVPGEGYRFAVLGPHDADVDDLSERVRKIAVDEVGRLYLHPVEHRAGWVVGEEDQIAGRLVFNPDGVAHRVVVDGRELSWDQLGEALEPYEGWTFRMVLEDPCTEQLDADH